MIFRKNLVRIRCVWNIPYGNTTVHMTVLASEIPLPGIVVGRRYPVVALSLLFHRRTVHCTRLSL